MSLNLFARKKRIPSSASDVALDFSPKRRSYVEIPHCAALSLTGDLTVELWIMLRAWPDDWTDIIAKFSDDLHNEFCFRLRDKSIGQWYYSNTSQEVPVAIWHPEEDIRLGEWTHLACVRKLGAYGRVYVNGALIRETCWEDSTPACGTENPLYLMAKPLEGHYLDGMIKGVKLWNVAKDEPAIRQGLACAPEADETGLVGHWTYDPRHFEQLTDRVGGRHGILHNTRWQALQEYRIDEQRAELIRRIAPAELALKEADWGASLNLWREIIRDFGPVATGRVSQIANALTVVDLNPQASCNFCGCPFFEDYGGDVAVKCLHCGSLDRTRLFYLHLQQLEILKPDAKVLHFAPEYCLYNVIAKALAPGNYTVADFDPERYDFVPDIVRFDLCNDVADLPANQFDLILHSHVFEHLPCNYTWVLYHLHRILKPTGLHVCIIPFIQGCYDDFFGQLPQEEAIRRFGQYDHVRLIGSDDIQNTFGKVLPIDKDYDVTRRFPPELLRRHNIPELAWRGLTTNTVLLLKKDDFRF